MGNMTGPATTSMRDLLLKAIAQADELSAESEPIAEALLADAMKATVNAVNARERRESYRSGRPPAGTFDDMVEQHGRAVKAFAEFFAVWLKMSGAKA